MASALLGKSPYDKIVAENERLVKDYKREVNKAEKLEVALSMLQIQHDKLVQEVEKFNKSASSSVAVKSPLLASPGQLNHLGHNHLEVKVEQLQADLEKKTAMLMEVKKLLKEAAEREKDLKTLSSDAQVKNHYSCITT